LTFQRTFHLYQKIGIISDWNSFQNEYINELQDKVYNILTNDKSVTIYRDIDKQNTSIKHYYKNDGQLTQIFEGKLRKIETENDKLNLKSGEEIELKNIKEQYLNKLLSLAVC